MCAKMSRHSESCGFRCHESIFVNRINFEMMIYHSANWGQSSAEILHGNKIVSKGIVVRNQLPFRGDTLRLKWVIIAS